jgi:hypothetical protein
MCCETSKSRRAVIYIALQYSRNTQAHVLLMYGFWTIMYQCHLSCDWKDTKCEVFWWEEGSFCEEEFISCRTAMLQKHAIHKMCGRRIEQRRLGFNYKGKKCVHCRRSVSRRGSFILHPGVQRAHKPINSFCRFFFDTHTEVWVEVLVAETGSVCIVQKNIYRIEVLQEHSNS